MSAPPLIFICYAGPDRPAAERIHRALNSAGLNPWCDALDLLPGQKWDEVIPGVLTKAAVVLVIVTARWPKVGDEGTGWYGPEEVAIAIDHARRVDPRMAIVPVRLDGVGPERLPYGLRRLADIRATAADPRPVVEGLTGVLEARARDLASPDRPALNQRLAAAYRRITTLEAQGASKADIEAAVTDKIAIKRSLRAGGHLEPGDELDRYVLAERLGQGGFASVWRAWDPTRGESVALKVLHGRWNRDASKVERFRRGVRQMARLKHPAVVPVLDADRQDNGWHFFVMQWLPGGDLNRAVTRAHDPLSVDAGLRAVLEVADALAEAHRRGVVHRDVKPQNILLGADGRAKLSDFDLVRAIDTSGGTGTGAMGTFLYAAPEQLDRPQDVGPRADVYALGMTAVFVLTGAQPETATKWQPAAAVARLPATAPMRACLLRAISLREAERPADAAAFATELRAALAPPVHAPSKPARVATPPASRPTDASPPPSAQPPRTPAARGAEPPTKPWPVIGALLALMAFGLVGVAGVIREQYMPGDDAAAAVIAGEHDTGILPSTADSGSDTVETDGGPSALPATANRPAMVSIAPGEFTMGSPADEAGRYSRERAHRVKLTRGFLMAETEVTQAQYAALVGSNPSSFQGTPADGTRPVENVSWLEAVEYCNALSAAEGMEPAYVIEGEAVTWKRDAAGYRLPAEAEWEYAARADTATATYAGDLDIRGERNAPALDAIAWYGGNSGSDHPKAWDSSDWKEKQYPHEKASTHPVKGKRPNPWGLYDMLGNVREWTWDRYAADYPESPANAPLVDPAGPPDGAFRVFRGGSFDNGARWVRAAYRVRGSPGDRLDWLGFRPVRAPRAP